MVFAFDGPPRASGSSGLGVWGVEVWGYGFGARGAGQGSRFRGFGFGVVLASQGSYVLRVSYVLRLLGFRVHLQPNRYGSFRK